MLLELEILVFGFFNNSCKFREEYSIKTILFLQLKG